MASRKKFYAVARGHVPGIYTEWFGEKGAEAQVRGVAGARFKGFYTLHEAKQWMEAPDRDAASPKRSVKKAPAPPVSAREGDIIIYTDGGCSCNPGPGGYGAVILDGGNRKELSGGFCRTTNNRMELFACIAGLQSIKTPSRVTLYSDSKYVVDAVNKKWAIKWRSKNWVKWDGKPALNADLWARLLDLIDTHEVQFIWVKGHAGNTENERCDYLATRAAAQTGLPPDSGCEK